MSSNSETKFVFMQIFKLSELSVHKLMPNPPQFTLLSRNHADSRIVNIIRFVFVDLDIKKLARCQQKSSKIR